MINEVEDIKLLNQESSNLVEPKIAIPPRMVGIVGGNEVYTPPLGLNN